MDIKNSIVLVTGASSGIGKATVLLFAKLGAKIAFSYKDNKNGADDTISEIRAFGVDVVAVQADLTKDEEVRKLVELTVNKFGQIDILVNNAGRYIEGDEWNGNVDTWEESFKQNFVSVLSVSKYVIENMHKQKSGVIVNISSRYSVSGQFDAPTYSAAKASIVNLTQGQAKLMAPWGRSNAVSPGVVRAGYWLKASKEELDENIQGVLLRQMVEPDDIAEAVVFLASDKAKMITGQNLIVDGGYTLK